MTLNRRAALGALAGALATPRQALAGQTLHSPLDLMQHIEPPRLVTGLAMADAAGKPLQLDAWRGRTVVLNVWASWCFPCRDEMPGLSRLAAAADPASLAVVPVAIERHGAEAVRKFFAEMQIANLPLILGDGKNVDEVFRQWGIPFTVLIDAEGREFGRVIGAARWDDPAFIAWIASRPAG